MSETRRIVVTSALPYANGDIHLGIWWNTCRPICGFVFRKCAVTNAFTCAR